MNRTATVPALLAAALLALSACATGDEDSETSGTAPSPEGLPTGEVPTDDTPMEATDGTDYDACFDGSCEVVVTAGTEIEFGSDFRIDTLLIEDVGDEFVSVSGDGVWSQFGPGGCGYVNGLGLTLQSTADGEAVMTFYPAIDCS